MKIGTATGLVAALAVAWWVCARLGGRSGVTDEEVGKALPGDELVVRPTWASTRAITIAAPAGEIWPWIAQMGYPSYRAGWYTPYWLDRLQWGISERSSDRVRPELVNLRVGDRVPDSPDWSVYFTVARLEPERALVLLSTRHVLKPVRSVEFSWAFVLQPIGTDMTRLVIRARVHAEPLTASLLLSPLIGIGDFLNASAMLRGIKARSESATRRRPKFASHLTCE